MAEERTEVDNPPPKKILKELIDIGNPVILSNRTDPSGRVNKKFRQGMHVVDLIPVDYNLSLSNFLKPDKVPGYMVEYNFESATEKYSKLCESYGLTFDGVGGLRLWLTGDTIAQEEFSNEFGDNIIQAAINTFSEYGGKIRELAKALGSDAQGDLKGISESLGQGASSLASTVGVGQKTQAGVGSAIETVGKLMIEGKHMSLPKVWKQSTYSPSLALNVKLISPYGSADAIKKYVLEPFLHLLLMVAPSSDDGFTYGEVPYVHVKAYGISNMNLAYIESVSVNRGGADTVYNIYRQPLSVDLTINLKPALGGFASIYDPNKDETKRLQDIFKLGDFGSGDDGYSVPLSLGPGLTTIGNIMQSFRPVPHDVEGNVLSGTTINKAPTGGVWGGAKVAGKEAYDTVGAKITGATS